MKKTATYYHAGCPVCQAGERGLVSAIDRDSYDVEIINVTEQPNRIESAESAGVKSLPALVIENQVFHINFGAKLADVKQKVMQKTSR